MQLESKHKSVMLSFMAVVEQYVQIVSTLAPAKYVFPTFWEIYVTR